MRLILTLPPTLRAQIDEAKPVGQSLSEYVRECIRQRIQRESQPPPTQQETQP